METKFYKDKEHGKIGGVCAGLAEYFKIDVTIVRVLTFLLIWTYGSGLILYIVLDLILPDKSSLKKEEAVNDRNHSTYDAEFTMKDESEEAE